VLGFRSPPRAERRLWRGEQGLSRAAFADPRQRPTYCIFFLMSDTRHVRGLGRVEVALNLRPIVDVNLVGDEVAPRHDVQG
jgi:hypothetical protein